MAEWEKKRQTMRHYDQLAKVYDAQYYEEQEAKINAALNSLTLRENSIVLDAGCGTGLLFPHVAEKVKLVVGMDISTLILKKAEKRTNQYFNTALIRADVDYAPFPNNTFDFVFAITLLQNTPNPNLTLNEMKRVTKKDAIIVATGLKKAFSQEKFTQELSQAGLEITAMRADEHLKGYVAICAKFERKP